MPQVELVHWNPKRPVVTGKLGRLLPKRAVNNFGDLLGPVVVERMLRRLGLSNDSESSGRRLVSIGSILHFAQDGDTVWGTGVNGKKLAETPAFRSLDVRAVRGPLTREYLAGKGIAAPEVYGDPGLLVGHLWTREELAGRRASSDYIVLPNFHDYATTPRSPHVVNPRDPLWTVVGRIAASRLVIGSSLHAMVIAESLGIPARLVVSGSEPLFKFDDYYRGTGREGADPAPSVDDALRAGGQKPIDWSPQSLMDSFPVDLWAAKARDASAQQGTDGGRHAPTAEAEEIT